MVLGLAALVAASLGACSNDSSRPQASPTPEPTTASAKARLNVCPGDAGQPVCDFAAAAERWIQVGDVDSLIGGGAFATDSARADLRQLIKALLPGTTDNPRKLRSVACPMVRDSPPRPDCTSRFALVFATLAVTAAGTEREGMLVFGYERKQAGPELSGYGIPELTWQRALLAGPMTGGGDLPGTAGTGLGFKIYPVEVLAPGQPPTTPVPGNEVIAGVEVRELTVGQPTSLPDDLVVYLGPAPWAADSFPILLWRVYRGPNGEIRRDDLFATAKAQLGPLAIVDWAGDEQMGEIVFVACPEGKCRGTGVGGWAGEFDAYRSTDGGITWSPFVTVPAMAFPRAVTAEGTIFGHFLGRDSNDRPEYRFFRMPSGQEVVPPAPNTEPRVVPGLGLIWEPIPVPQATFGTQPVYGAEGKVVANLQPEAHLQPHLAGVLGGAIYGSWEYVPDRPADPHSRAGYFGQLDSVGKPVALYTPGRIAGWNGPYLAGRGLLLGNAEISGAGVRRSPFDVPAVLVDLSTGKALPLRELDEGLSEFQQPIVRGAVPGRVARVKTSGDCLNVRETPSAGAASLACYRDGVLLLERGEMRVEAGTSWLPVTTPDGRDGWASVEFVERR
jgi:hypothetical protein